MTDNKGENKGKIIPRIIAGLIIAIIIVAMVILGLIYVPKFINKDTPVGVNPQVGETEFSRELLKDSVIKSIVADSTEGNYIETDTSFTIQTSEDIDEEKIKTYLCVSPEIDYNISKKSSCNYTLKTNKNLPSASLLKLSVKDDDGNTKFSWAFQTVETFRVKSTTPDNESRYVPLDTGIEIYFSDLVDKKDAKDYFKISPDVSGHFENYRYTLVFVPDLSLKTNTVYTVTIKAGFVSVSGLTLEKDKTFAFKTEESDDYEYIYTDNKISESFLPEDVPLVQLYASDELCSSVFDVNLYRYNNADEYYNTLKDYCDNNSFANDYTFKTDGLENVFSIVQKPLHNDAKRYGPSYFLLPEDLEEGYYLADIKTTYNGIEYNIQQNIEINSLSVFANLLPNQAAFFINDTETGEAASNAIINLYTGKETVNGTTKDDGTAMLDYQKSEAGTSIIKVDYNGKTFIDSKKSYTSYSEGPDCDWYENYIVYLYTDREVYLTTDTVNIFGMIQKRTPDSPDIPQDLYIMLGYDKTDGQCVSISPESDGTFKAAISFEKGKETYSTPVRLMSGENVIRQKYITLNDYVKPTYIIQPDVPVYSIDPQTNPVPVNVNTTYFDGTPANDVELEITSYDSIENSGNNKYKSDKSGNISTDMLFKDDDSWRPSNLFIYFQTSGIENETQYAYGKIFGIFRDVMIDTSFEDKDDTGVLKVKTSMINPDKIEPDMYFYSDNNNDIIRGNPFDTTVTATLMREYYTKTETGSYYDFLEKKNVKSYNYTWQNEVVDTYTISTVNGEGEFTGLNLDKKEESSYYVELEWTDSKGRTVHDTANIYNRYLNNDDYQNNYYTFHSDENTFKEDQDIDFSLYNKYNKVTDFEGKIFYTVNSFKFIDTGIVSSPEFSYKMNDECIPDVGICGAYFDGKHVYAISSEFYTYNFDPSEREIEIDIQPDKDKYRPSDNAEVKIKATYKDGTAAADARVSLSVVDEAAFAIGDQTADALSYIYSFNYIPTVTSFCSYNQYSLNDFSAGEKGGGGEENFIRKDFKDTASFQTGVTDSDGNVTFSFKVPDNLTTWRTTVQAIGKNSQGKIYAGSTKAPIIVTQPLFINPIALSEYVVGDDISFSAKCAGDNSENAEITAKVTGDGFDKTLTASQNESMNFGKLKKGRYSVLFTAKNNEDSDAVKLDFEVVDSLLETPVTKSFDLNSEAMDIEPSRWPVSILFYNKQYDLYNNILCQFSSKNSNRLDFRITNAFSAEQFGYYTEDEYKNLFTDITDDGLANLLPYSDDDYELTALICVSAPELVNKGAVSDALYNKLSDREATAADIANCYLGLSALSEPVLSDVNQLLDNYSYQFSYQDKLKLCAALALSGDYNSAYTHYKELTDYMNITTDENGISRAYLLKTDVDSDKISSTRFALITASILNLDEADAMARYLSEENMTDEAYYLELMAYLRNYVPQNKDDAVFEYTLDGKTEKVTLNKFYGSVLSFGEKQFKNAGFKVVSGDVGCTAFYISSTDETEQDESLTVKKTYTPVNGTWEPGSLIQVKITVSGSSPARVDDVIPSCARFVKFADKTWGSRSGQRIKLFVGDNRTVTYYIKLVSSGEFVTGNCVANDSDENYGKSEHGTITVD